MPHGFIHMLPYVTCSIMIAFLIMVPMLFLEGFFKSLNDIRMLAFFGVCLFIQFAMFCSIRVFKSLYSFPVLNISLWLFVLFCLFSLKSSNSFLLGVSCLNVTILLSYRFLYLFVLYYSLLLLVGFLQLVYIIFENLYFFI